MANIPTSVLTMSKVEGILITVTGAKYNPGKHLLAYRLSPVQMRDFTLYMALELCEAFRLAIDNQRYAKGSHAWVPLSINYRTQKGVKNLSLDIWKATGQLRDEIKVFRQGNRIAVGFSPTDNYDESGLEINKVARYLEFGGRKLNPLARPLFRLVTEYTRKNVGRYYKNYQKELQKAKKPYLYL